MRFALFALLGLAIWCPLSQAQAANVVFGGFPCMNHIPCEQADPAFPTTQQLITAANSCVAQNMGITSPNGFFNEVAGLDSNGCLTTDASTFSTLGNLRSIPQCCVTQSAAGAGAGCTLHCDLIGQSN